jgi:hypothetical protein
MSQALEATVRVELPASLRVLARLPCEIELAVRGPVTLQAVLDALEEAYPVLRGTVRDQTSKLRRPFIRFFACAEDLSHRSPEDPLPEAVRQGHEPLLIIGAIAGG